MAATGAQRGLAAFVLHHGQADAVGLCSGSSGFSGRRGRHLLALHRGQFVGDGPRVQRQAGDVCDAVQARDQFRLYVELEQAEHLRVAVLFDHVNTFVLLDELVHFAGEGIRPQPQVIGFNIVFVALSVMPQCEVP